MIEKEELFKKKANLMHNGKYDYSKVNYINNKTKVCIVCPIHGDFYQAPRHHLSGSGCPKCAGTYKYTTDEWIEAVKRVHGEKYDYSKVEYKKSSEKVCVICPNHGEYYITPNHHLRGVGCPKCGGSFKSNTDSFIKRAGKVHDNYYDYSKVNYINSKTNVCIICPRHREFYQTPLHHLSGQGCPKCSSTYSKAEDEIMELLTELNPQHNNKTILNGKEIDIFIPSLKIGIEYNGLLWHSEKYGKDRSYHIGKLNNCNRNGVELIQIFEDEWISHRKICEYKIKEICGINDREIIIENDCAIRPLTNKNEANEFLENNCISGAKGFSIGVGAYYNDNLIGAITFKKYGVDGFLLVQSAIGINYKSKDIKERLFEYFIKNYEFKQIVCFADRRWTINPFHNEYIKLGFSFNGLIDPNYMYYKLNSHSNERINKTEIKKIITEANYKFSDSMTENDIAKKLGYSRIWDCGKIKYIYKKPTA